VFTPRLRSWTHSAAHSAHSVEVKDFEEEKSFDKRRNALVVQPRLQVVRHHYFAGRVLPQRTYQSRSDRNPEPSSFTRGALSFVDAYYDTRSGYNGKPPRSPSRLFGPCHHDPEYAREQLGVVYASGDGSLTTIDYAKESTSGSAGTLNGLSSSVFVTRNGAMFSPPIRVPAF